MQTSIGRSACDFFFNDTATTEIYTLSLHDPLPISCGQIVYIQRKRSVSFYTFNKGVVHKRSEEHTFELQSLAYLVCRLLLEKKKRQINTTPNTHLRAEHCAVEGGDIYSPRHALPLCVTLVTTDSSVLSLLFCFFF